MSFWNEEVFTEAEAQTAAFEVLPEGEYPMVLVDSGVKTTKAGTGHYVNCQFEITGSGRRVFQTFNVHNPNPKAVSIGLGQLKDFLVAAGREEFYQALKTVTNWEEAEAHLNTLFSVAGNIPVTGKVVIKRDETYGDKNEIKSFKPAAAVTATPSPTAKKPF